MLRKNVTHIDRIIRIVIGLALLALVVVGPKTLWGLLGLIPLVTGALGTCPIYRVLFPRLGAKTPGRPTD